MNPDPQRVLDKFWAGTATEAERQWLLEQLGPDGAQWQAQLRREFAEPPARPEERLTEAQSARVLARLRRQLPAAAPGRSVWDGWPRWAAAAGIVLASGLALHRYAAPDSITPKLVAHSPARPAWRLVSEENAGPAPRRLSLADGSVVTLQPRSALRYYAPFGRAGRTISLRGAALFAVAKDTAHPFTVLAGGFTTTALGTRFRVQNTEAHRVTVRLLEGKVVVRATPASHLTMRAQYLTPGRELTVNTQTRQVRVHSFGPAPAPRGPLVVVVPTGLTFEKDDLPTVFAQVSKRYHVRFAYDPATVRGLTFSGAFAATDPLPVVLRAVCAPNNLSFTQAPGRVAIRKAP